MSCNGGGERSEPFPLPDALAAGLLRRSVDQIQLASNGRSGHAVLGHVAIGLEVEQRSERVRSEDAIDLSRIESESVQSSLQVGDIVAPEHREPVVEESPAKTMPRLHQGAPGLGADDAVRPEIPAALERDDGGVGALTEVADHVGPAFEAQRGEPALNIPDRLSRIR